jgi:hypothetical protein
MSLEIADVVMSNGSAAVLKHKRRYCRADGCTSIVKSQGLCQRHGAKPRKCRVESCTKQAQGNFDGMCKSHFKAHKRATTPLPPKPDPSVALLPPEPVGESVYDSILPASLSWNSRTSIEKTPLIAHLEHGFHASKPPAWHRNEERQARGLWPVHNPATQVEGWERDRVWMEILLLTGNPEASFRHLARGWGRDKGFHMVLAQFICERHGNVERKKRERPADASAGGAEHRRTQKGPTRGSDFLSTDVWDDTVYGDVEYNNALAADLLELCADDDDDDQSVSERSFTFECDDFVVSSSSGGKDGHADSLSSSSQQTDGKADDSGDTATV